MNQKKSDKLCWWCQERTGNTAEHRIKKTRLDQEESKTKHRGKMWMEYTGAKKNVPFLSEIRGTKAKSVKFPPSMCKECNGARSRDFDDSYQYFADWAYANQELIRKNRLLDWSKIFQGTHFDQRHLARYYIKNMCCRIDEYDLEIPPQLINYLDNLEAEPCFCMTTYRNFELVDLYQEKLGIEDYFQPNIQHGMNRSPTDPRKIENAFAIFFDGYIGVFFSWIKEFEYQGEKMVPNQRKSPIFEQDEIPIKQLLEPLEWEAQWLRSLDPEKVADDLKD